MEMNNKPSRLSDNPLHRDGKDSSLSKRNQEILSKTEVSLKSISKAGLFKATNEQAWLEGTNIKSALRVKPEETRAAVIMIIAQVSEFLDGL